MSATSAQDLTTTRDCVAWGCTMAAEWTDGLCGEHHERKLHGNLRVEVMADPPPCKRPGCTERSAGAERGPYSGLCTAHTEETREQRSAEARERSQESWSGGTRKRQGTDETLPAEVRAESGIQWTRERLIEAVPRWLTEHGQLPTSADWQKRHDGFPTYPAVRRYFVGWEEFMEACGYVLDGQRKYVSVSGEEVSTEPAESAVEPVPAPETAVHAPTNWLKHPDLMWPWRGSEEEEGPVTFVDATLEFEEALGEALSAIRRLRAARDMVEEFAKRDLSEANVLLHDRSDP